MRRVKVLYLPQPGLEPVWDREVVAAVGSRHDLEILDGARPLPEQFRGIEVVIDMGGSVGTREMYDAARDAKLWQILGTGLDHVDVEYMKTRGFAIANCPGQFSSTGLAECAMMYILMLTRRYAEAQANFRAGVKYKPLGRELEGMHLGIIGFGASGRELALRARAFGMRVRAVDVLPPPADVLARIQPERVGGPEDTDDLISRSDVVSLHLHLTPRTRHTLDARRIALMKRDALLINVARGALVDEEALYAALVEGRIGGAGLDVFAREPPDPGLPVYGLPNVVVTPHVAGATTGTARKRAAAAAENVDRVAQGLDPLYRVDGR